VTEYSGSGDPVRGMELLWGERKRSTRGPRPGLTVDRIARAAIELADAAGLEALSMRRVADQLGVGAMSLYTYVPGKAELLDVMLDTVLGEIRAPEDGGGWRAGLEHWAREDWSLYHRHPWMLQVAGTRALLGPNELARYDGTLHALADTGLSGREMVLVTSVVAGYVRGAAQGAVEAAHAERRTGLSDDQWWAARAPLLERYYDPERYPTITSVEASGAFQPTGSGAEYNLQHALDSFEFGLQRVLDGIAAFVDARTRD
jgi:AcrR family transcriptional regulator